MSAEVKARIAEELALLTQLVPFPEPPLGYGSDISCDTDVDPGMTEIPGDSTLGLAQSVVRRLDCPRGENPDDPNYGIGLRQFLNTGTDDSDINSLGGQIRVELLKDDRINGLRVTVIPQNNAGTLDVHLSIEPVDREIGGFDLTLTASSSAILIEAIRSKR